MAISVTDTHPLVWYAAGHYRRLSKHALRLFSEADAQRGLVIVPAAVLWEVAMLLSERRIGLPQPFVPWASTLVRQRGFDLAPLDLEVINQAVQFRFNDIFDAAIVATATTRDLPLITKDQAICESRVVEVAW